MTELQCHISGGLLPPEVEGHAVQFRNVRCDAGGNLWIVDTSLQNVFYFTRQEISHRQKQFELQLRSSHTSPSCKPIYSCKKADETVLSIMCTTLDSFYLTHILTTRGTLCVLYTKAEDASSSPVLLHEWQLATEVTSVVMAHSSVSLNEVQFFAGCYDGVYGEVIVVSLSFDAQTPAATGLSGSLDARGVFRIKGRLSQLLWQADGVDALLLSVSHDGNIDVWDWKLEKDVTQNFGGISWDVVAHGAPCEGGAVLHESKLWLPTEKGTIVVLPFSSGQARSKALLLDAHSGPIRQLLLMSGGRHMWSYADGGRVSVWDTNDVSFKGSFLFPDCRIADLACADLQLVTHLWAVDSETGGLASLVVNESMQKLTGTLVPGNEALRQARENRSIMEQLETVFDRASHELLAAGLNPLHAGAANGRSDAMKKMETLVELVQDYAASTSLVSSFSSEADANGNYTKIERSRGSLEMMLACLIADYRRSAALEGDIQEFCSSVGALMQESRNLTSLEDVLEALTEWKEELKKQQAKEDVEMMEVDAMPLKDVIAELEKELREKDFYTSELDRRIVELLNEQRELSIQLERSQQGLSDRDQQLAVLQRTVDAAKKAAELASADTAQLFELESCLHMTREKEKRLEAELEQLRAKEDMYQQSEEWMAALEQKVSLYEVKEKIAVHAIEDFISVQNNLFEEVTALVDWLSTAGVDDNSTGVLADHSYDALVDECRNKLLLLEAHFSEKVSQQKKYFSLLRSEYGTTVSL